MFKLRNVFLICIILFLLIALLPSFGVRTAFAYSPPFTVVITPPNAGAKAEYDISGGISEYDDVGVIKVSFKKSTNFESSEIPENAIKVNEKHPLKVSYSELVDAKEITIVLGKKIQSGEEIHIFFSKDAGIKNPILPAQCYVLSAKLLRNGILLGSISSKKYTITHSKVSIPKVTVREPVQGVNAEYEINFTTGVNGFLHKGVDDIRIKLPDGTGMPVNFFSKFIQIKIEESGKYYNSSAIYRDTRDPYKIRIFSPVDIKTNTNVTVVIKKEFGLINTRTPSKEGEYVFVSDAQEPDEVASEPFMIMPPKIQNLSINLGSDIITMDSSIHIGFVTSPIGFLMKGKSIYINFPDGFALPGSIDSSFVTVNGKNAEAEVAGRQIIIHTPENIGSNADVIVEISEEAHIANPVSFGEYAIEVQTDSDTYAVAATVSITQSSVQNVVLGALYSGTGTKNEFNITFATGTAGELTSDVDYVKVYFGNAFELPETISEGTIFINDIPVNNVSIDVYSVIATIPAGIGIGGNSEVKVKITTDFGIKNPQETGDYVLKVSTSKETAARESNALTIILLPVVEFVVSPSNPDGKNGFYKSKPNVQLSSFNGGAVYFKEDDGEFLSYGGQSIVITEGEHKIFAYAVDEIGNKGDVYERNFKVDSTPPTVNFGHGSGNIYVNTTHAVLTGSVSEPCKLKINSIIVAVADDLSFSHELDVMNNSPLAIYMKDLAGNSVSIMRTVYLDEEAPVITMLFPDKEQYDTAEETVNIRLKLSEEGTVMVNGKAMDFNGSVFSITVNLYSGENNFYITVADAAGNKTTKNIRISRVNEIVIKLQIGSAIAYVGSEVKTLNTAPIIQNGRTLVPIRFIAEALGATVDWNGDLQIIMITHKTHTIQLQIGSFNAFIDRSNKITLNTAPIIQNGRTLVPLRFIMETFGATVDWENETKTITIIYTP